MYFGERVFGDWEVGLVMDEVCIFVGEGISIVFLLLLMLLMVLSNWWYEWVDSLSCRGVVIFFLMRIVGFFKLSGILNELVFLDWWLIKSLNVVLWRICMLVDLGECRMFLLVNDFDEVFFDFLLFIVK